MTTTPSPAVYGKELVQSALYGAGATTSAAALYHLLNGLQSAQVPELLRNEAPAAAKPKAPAKKKQKPALKLASASQLAESVFSAIGNRISKDAPWANLNLSPTTGPQSPTAWHEGYRNTANLLAAAAGGYGGLKLVGALADQKKKEDLAAEVDTARKEYFDALTGKRAAALDAVYDDLEKTGSLYGAGWTTALLAALGSGAVGASYMYNQTKSRSRAENLRRAAAARARLRGLQQTPWVDPEQLAALTPQQ